MPQPKRTKRKKDATLAVLDYLQENMPVEERNEEEDEDEEFVVGQEPTRIIGRN